MAESELTTHISTAVIRGLLVLSLESDDMESQAESGVQTSQKTQVID